MITVRSTKGLPLEFWVAASPMILVVLIFLLGGGSRPDIESLVFLRPLAAVALVLALFTLRSGDITQHRFIGAMTLAIVLLSLVHVLPIPADLFYSLPGREIVEQIDRTLGSAVEYRSLAMSPAGAWNALWSLLVPLSVLACIWRLPFEGLSRLATIILAIAGLSAVIGVLQVVGPSEGPLYFYAVTNGTDPVGLFANRNHQALLLACSFPVAGYAASLLGDDDTDRRRTWLALYAGIVALNLFVLLGTGSRAGVVLGALGLLAMVLIYREAPAPRVSRSRARRPSRLQTLANSRKVRWAAGILALGALVAVFAGSLSLQRYSDPGQIEELRMRAWPVIAGMVSTYWPWGSGIGSFDAVYKIGEPDALLSPFYLNHAHNDWLEVALTTGLPGIILMAAAVVAWAVATLRLVASKRRNRGGRRYRLGLAGSAIIALAGMASIVDYPLRTPSLAVLVVIAAMWLSTATAVRAKEAE